MPPLATHPPHRVLGAAASGNCHKFRLALDLLRVAYRWHEVDLMKGETRSPDFLRINPNGKPLTLGPGRINVESANSPQHQRCCGVRHGPESRSRCVLGEGP